MQPTQAISFLALLPYLTGASPVAMEGISNSQRSALERRAGIDFRGSDYRAAGDSGTFDSSESDPHACGINDRSVVVSTSNVM